jgi:uncharacterized protein
MTTSPMIFFLLVFVLSVPFYVLGAFGGRLPGLQLLPDSALMAFLPMFAALILVHRSRGAAAIVTAIQNMLAASRSTGLRWYVMALLFLPAICIFEFGIIRLTGIAVPFPQVTFGEVLFYFAAFFIGAIGEEAGWQGYAYPALKSGRSAITSALILGVIWAVWHVIPFIQLGRSGEWIMWHSLSAVAMRIIIVWLFERSGSNILVAVLFHTMINASWALFPIAGSYYDPFITFVLLAVSAGLIVLLWWRSTKHRNSFA